MTFVDHSAEVLAKLNRAATRALTKTGMRGSGEVKKSMKARGGGTVMRVDAAGNTRSVTYKHLPSNPGETPAVQTGTYRASFDFDVTPGLLGAVRIGTPDKRGPWLEKGTSKMAPRPHLQPIIESKAREISAEFASEFRKEMES